MATKLHVRAPNRAIEDPAHVELNLVTLIMDGENGQCLVSVEATEGWSPSDGGAAALFKCGEAVQSKFICPFGKKAVGLTPGSRMVR